MLFYWQKWLWHQCWRNAWCFSQHSWDVQTTYATVGGRKFCRWCQRMLEWCKVYQKLNPQSNEPKQSRTVTQSATFAPHSGSRSTCFGHFSCFWCLWVIFSHQCFVTEKSRKTVCKPLRCKSWPHWITLRWHNKHFFVSQEADSCKHEGLCQPLPWHHSLTSVQQRPAQ